MKLKIILIINFFIFFLNIVAFSRSNNIFFGTYENRRCNFIFRLIHKSKYPDLKIEILKDSNYIYYSCNLVEKGKWNIVKDTLFLYSYEIEYKNDSIKKIMNLNKLKINKNIFLIKKNRIIDITYKNKFCYFYVK